MKPHRHHWTPWYTITSLSPLYYDGWRRVRKCSGCLKSQVGKGVISVFSPTGRVTARQKIQQSPLHGGPVPKGRTGYIQDEADGYLWVDFGGVYGTVCCEYVEVK